MRATMMSHGSSKFTVKAGHALVKKKDDAPLKGRVDSFVVETDVHYPTDTNLLFDMGKKYFRCLSRIPNGS